MRIIHMADCHLDSAMETSLSPEAAKVRRRELLLTFSNTIAGAKTEDVRLCLIAGDLFDTPRPAPAALRYVLDTLTAHPEMDFILIEGNHDIGAFAGVSLPKNVFLVKAGEGHVFAYPDLTVFAGGYGISEEALRAFPIEPQKKNIMLLHGTLTAGGGRGEALPLSALEGRGIDYIALGHYHKRQARMLSDGTTMTCYAGVPEGRGFDETGPCGVILLDSDTMSADFIPVAGRILHDLSLDISEMDSAHAIEEGVKTLVEAIPDKDMVHLVLTGRTPEGVKADVTQLQAYLDSRFFFARVKDKSRLLLHAGKYENDISLRGEFVRRAKAAITDENDLAKILSFGLRAIAGEEIDD